MRPLNKTFSIDFMAQDEKTNRTVALTMDIQYQQPLQFNEASPLVNIIRLSHDGLKMLFGGGMSRMVGTGMKAKKQPYKIESEDCSLTLSMHLLVMLMLIRRIGKVYCCLLLRQTGSDNI